MRVYLVRHAEAEQGSPDELRPLTSQGRVAALSLAEKLSTHHLKIKNIYHSKLVRAAQTAAIFAHTLDIKNISVSSGLSPNDNPSEWSKKIEALDEDIMLVGHMPFMSLLVENLSCHEDTVIFSSPQMACLEKKEPGIWRVLWKEGA